MAYEFITLDQKDHLTILTINRPERMNALHPPANLEMQDALDGFADDPEQWVAIITGAGEKAFSAGNDLKYQAEHGGKAVSASRGKLKYGFGGIVKRFDCFKPIIAAVNGFALGGGFEIALACDIIIASEKATFGLPEPRVGLMAAAGGVHRLPRHVPYHVGMGMILASKRIDANEAYRLGLVNEVVMPDKLMETAEHWANEIMQGAPMSIRASKEATLMGSGLTLDQALNTTFPTFLAMMQSEDFVEGPKAFAEKRKPDWKGR